MHGRLPLFFCHCTVATVYHNLTESVQSEPLITNMKCSGGENSLSECNSTYLSGGDYSCSIAGVRCTSGETYVNRITSYHTLTNFNSLLHFVSVSSPLCYNGQVQLRGVSSGNVANGYYYTEGLVEVCVNGIYSAICDEGWDNNAAAVVCHSIGLSNRTA